jgi:hypothetical protein
MLAKHTCIITKNISAHAEIWVGVICNVLDYMLANSARHLNHCGWQDDSDRLFHMYCQTIYGSSQMMTLYSRLLGMILWEIMKEKGNAQISHL